MLEKCQTKMRAVASQLLGPGGIARSNTLLVLQSVSCLWFHLDSCNI